MAELQDISGIGPATAALLGDHGLTSVKKLAKADLAAITAVPGFGPTRARAVQAAARAVLPAKTPGAGRPEAPSGSRAPESVDKPEGAERSTSKGGKKKSSKDAKNKKKASKKKKKAKKG